MFLVQRPGLSLGLDAILRQRLEDSANPSLWRRVLGFFS
jgi:hypothetical protein